MRITTGCLLVTFLTVIGSNAHAETIGYNFGTDPAVAATPSATTNELAGLGVVANDFQVDNSSAVPNLTGVLSDADTTFTGANWNGRLNRQVGEGNTTEGVGTVIFSFSVVVPDDVTLDLTQLSFTDGIDHNVRAEPEWNTASTWAISITRSGGGSPAAAPPTVTNSLTDSTVSGVPNNDTQKDNDLTLSGLTGISDETVTFTFTSDFIRVGLPEVRSNNRWAWVDDVELTATNVVPEPGSLALMGVGALLIARRRRG